MKMFLSFLFLFIVSWELRKAGCLQVLPCASRHELALGTTARESFAVTINARRLNTTDALGMVALVHTCHLL